MIDMGSRMSLYKKAQIAYRAARQQLYYFSAEHNQPDSVRELGYDFSD